MPHTKSFRTLLQYPTYQRRVGLANVVTSGVGRRFSKISSPEAGRHAAALARELRNKSMSTTLAHMGVRPSVNASMSPPLHLASTYTREPDGDYAGDAIVYNRWNNPTRVLLEQEVARLECEGRHVSADLTCCAYASGMMAAASIILAHKAPVTVLLAKDCYYGVGVLLYDVLSRFGVHTQRVDLLAPDCLTSTIDEIPDDHDVIVWMESPSNPHCHIIDIEHVCGLARASKRKVTTVVDSTLAPPPIQQPLRLGADLSMHSATKYMGGHSDVLCGVVTASPVTERGQELAPILRETQTSMGGVASPMDAWLVLRGLRTLSVRVQQQCASALQIATFLDEHAHVIKVHYPGLGSHTNHDVAQVQMNGKFGGVLSFELASEPMAMAVVGAVQIFQRATSLGGTESLIEHRASIEPEERRVSAPGLLRLSVGLEDTDDLIRDLQQAIAIAVQVVGDEASA